jgi:uncharacterized DUF497 family protein
VKFEWNPDKAAHNLKKHGIAFEDATSVFGDPFAGTIPDPLHSTVEARFVTIGMTSGLRLVVVVHTDRKHRVRIISARPATRAEKKKHEEAKKART